MPTGKHDNDNWRKKLEQLEQLPGQAFDKTAAWKTLETRLEQKPSGKKVWLFWPIAASLLIIALLAIFFIPFNRKHKPAVAKSIINKQNNAIKTDRETVTIPTIKKKLIPISLKKENTVSTKIIIPTIVLPTEEQQPTEEVVTTTPIDTTSKAIATVVKKKRRVVHINEVIPQTMSPTEPEPTGSVASNSSNMPLFKRAVINNEIYYNSENILPVTKHKKPLLPFGSVSPKD